MINLGLINGCNQNPAGVHRVFLYEVGSYKDFSSELLAPGGDGCGAELRLNIPAGFTDKEDLGQVMSQVISDLHWNYWSLDCDSLSSVLKMSPTNALDLWGSSFWPGYNHDCNIYLDVSGHRRTDIFQSITRWEFSFPYVRFNCELDLDFWSNQQKQSLFSLTRVSDFIAKQSQKILQAAYAKKETGLSSDKKVSKL